MSESPASRTRRGARGRAGGGGIVGVGSVVVGSVVGGSVVGGVVGEAPARAIAACSRISGTSQSATSLAVSWLKWTPSGRRRTSSG